MDRDTYTTFLPLTPSAKLQAVIKMMQQGLLGPAEARNLLDCPDPEAANDADEIERLLGMVGRHQHQRCTCGSGHPRGPLHDNYPWYTCPLYDDSPAPGSRTEKEAELERAKEGRKR